MFGGFRSPFPLVELTLSLDTEGYPAVHHCHVRGDVNSHPLTGTNSDLTTGPLGLSGVGKD